MRKWCIVRFWDDEYYIKKNEQPYANRNIWNAIECALTQLVIHISHRVREKEMEKEWEMDKERIYGNVDFDDSPDRRFVLMWATKRITWSKKTHTHTRTTKSKENLWNIEMLYNFYSDYFFCSINTILRVCIFHPKKWIKKHFSLSFSLCEFWTFSSCLGIDTSFYYSTHFVIDFSLIIVWYCLDPC